MSRLISVADDVYAELTRLKSMKKASYTEVIREVVFSHKQKTGTWKEVLAFVDQLEKEFTGPKITVDVDKIAYGVSREGN